VRWRRLSGGGPTERNEANPAGGHHDVTPVHRDGHRVQRGLVGYFLVALGVLIVSTLSADSDIADGRTLLIGDEVDGDSFMNWSESVAAADAEILGLTVYDYSLLIGLVFIALEMVRLWRKPKGDRKLWFFDSLASLSTQIPFYLVEVLSVLAMISAYFFLWDNATLWQLPVNGFTIFLAIIAADFAYYWEHRTSHEIRLLWTGHAVHHSSPVFNTAVAFRFGPIEPFVAVMFHLPLILLGFHPALVIMGELTVQAYQFWIHTDVIGRLGPVDAVLNTPSNHRVHHGSNNKYLDKNHGGILMIWDRMFGTYQAEEETPTYGLTTQIETTNPLKVWFSEFPSLFADLRSAASWREWFGYLINPPGWTPSKPS
jgi:sterol desaturase/sphingolipid hydroxylase (fatty acid hydroxylase superfamily)